MMWLDDHHGFTPSHCAAHAGHAGALQVLAAAKANIANGRTERGDLPLHLASLGGHDEVVSLLLAAKADAAARNSEDWTPLHLAVLQGAREENRAVAGLLLEASPPPHGGAAKAEAWSVLGLCAHHGHTELLGLLTAKLGFEGTNRQGDTALHLGALAGHADVVRSLARAGASVNASNRLGHTPAHMALHGASQHEDGLECGKEVLRMLSGLGASLMEQDQAGDTVLHLAVALPGFEEVERLALVEWLVGKGLGSKPRRNAKGFTPLALGQAAGPSLAAVSMLLEGAEAKANAQPRGMVVCMKRKRGSDDLSSVVLEEAGDPVASMKRLRVTPSESETGKGGGQDGGQGESSPPTRKRKLFRLVKEVPVLQGEDAPAPRALEGVANRGLMMKLPKAPAAAGHQGAKRARHFEQVGKRRRFAEGEAVVLNEHSSTAREPSTAAARQSPIRQAHIEMLLELGLEVPEIPEGYLPGGAAPAAEEEVWGIYIEDETALDEELDAPEAIAHVSSVDVTVYDYSDPDACEEDIFGGDGYDSNEELYGYDEAPEQEEEGDGEQDELYIPRMDNPC